MDTEVLLEVESVLGHPERVPHVGLDKLHPLDTLVTCELSGFGRLVWVTGSPGLADVSRPVHKEVLDDHVEHSNVAVCQVLKALLYILLISLVHSSHPIMAPASGAAFTRARQATVNTSLSILDFLTFECHSPC